MLKVYLYKKFYYTFTKDMRSIAICFGFVLMLFHPAFSNAKRSHPINHSVFVLQPNATVANDSPTTNQGFIFCQLLEDEESNLSAKNKTSSKKNTVAGAFSLTFSFSQKLSPTKNHGEPCNHSFISIRVIRI